MKRVVILIVMILAYSFSAIGQKTDFENIETLIKRMAQRSDEIQNLKKNKDIRAYFNSQTEDSEKCISYLMNERDYLNGKCDSLNRKCDSLTVMNSELIILRLLTSPDTTVFHLPLPQLPVPVCLIQHTDLIKRISGIRGLIETQEKRIEMLKRGMVGKSESEIKELISKAIYDDIMLLDSLITEIEESDLSSLSEEQKRYFKPGLTKRYNSFLSFFD
jgi:hypothetical protein